MLFACFDFALLKTTREMVLICSGANAPVFGDEKQRSGGMRMFSASRNRFICLMRRQQLDKGTSKSTRFLSKMLEGLTASP